jgi:sulfate adenylyltransferase
MINPHGGKLIERSIGREKISHFCAKRSIILDDQTLSDALMIAIGGFSPLLGFMSAKDYIGVLKNMRLSSGLLFAIPIVLPVDKALFGSITLGETIILKDQKKNIIGLVEVSDRYQRDLKKEALSIYGTLDSGHPGVKMINQEGPYAIGGKIKVVKKNIDISFPQHFLTPKETRTYFRKQGWQTVAAFQTRNPIHRAHEYLTKIALEMTDGLMIHPIVGKTESRDISADIRMQCYQILIKKYYPRDRVLLNVLPMAMRYAGPREAILHAIIRQNYGCSHIIIGRDHAGVDSYYGTYDAQKIFDRLGADDLEIIPLKFEHAFYCKKCGQLVSMKVCPHDKSHHLFLSGTRIREILERGEDLPEEFTRKEVSDILRKNQRPGMAS